MKPPVLLALSLALTAALAAAADRPNIVFILADDMGYGDVHALNPGSTIPTPNLDKLAGSGMSFTDAHTPSAVCTPTRYGVVTGRYCWRTRLKSGVLNGYDAHLIDPERLTVAKYLHQQGYHTGVVGKWHLGMDFAKDAEGKFDYTQPIQNGANTMGFDFSYVIPASLDFPPYFFIRNQAAVMLPTATQPQQPFPAFTRAGERAPNFEMEDCLDHLLGQATGYIGRRSATGQPFFLYFPLTAPHKPTLPHPRFRGKSGLGPYGDFVIQVDWTVGQVLKTLDDLKLTKSTLVFFTSDNGSYMYRYDDADKKDHVEDSSVQGFRAEHHRANFEFRGTKADVWEGGHHVPFFVRWPGVIKPGSTSSETVCLTDFFATCVEVTGGTLPDNAAEDSFSLLPLLKGGTWPTPRAPVINHSAGGMFAIREGAWKLVLGNGSGGRQAPKGKPFEKPYQLFNLSSDIVEASDQLDRQAQIAARLEADCLRIRDSGRSRP